MSERNHIPGVLLLVAIYCFGIGLSTPKAGFSNDFIECGTTQKKQFSALSKGLCFHTSSTETSVTAIKEYAGLNFIPDFEGFETTLRASELRFYARFRQYISYLKTVRLRPLKTDLIFPFHTFW